MDDRKVAVRYFWDRASCGEELYLRGPDRFGYERLAQIRYELEPYIQRAANEYSRSAWALEQTTSASPRPVRFLMEST